MDGGDSACGEDNDGDLSSGSGGKMRQQRWLLPCARSAPPSHGSGSRSSSSDGDTQRHGRICGGDGLSRDKEWRNSPPAPVRLPPSTAALPSLSLCFLGFHSLFPAFPCFYSPSLFLLVCSKAMFL
nr:uncharacterized protein LOC114925860 [Arachis hypogaea]